VNTAEIFGIPQNWEFLAWMNDYWPLNQDSTSHFEGRDVKGTGSGSCPCCLVFAARDICVPLPEV
jgi:hypothetical protein